MTTHPFVPFELLASETSDYVTYFGPFQIIVTPAHANRQIAPCQVATLFYVLYLLAVSCILLFFFSSHLSRLQALERNAIHSADHPSFTCYMLDIISRCVENTAGGTDDWYVTLVPS